MYMDSVCTYMRHVKATMNYPTTKPRERLFILAPNLVSRSWPPCAIVVKNKNRDKKPKWRQNKRQT